MTITKIASVGVLKDPYQVFATREERFFVDFDDGTHEVLTCHVALRFPMAEELRRRLLLDVQSRE